MKPGRDLSSGSGSHSSSGDHKNNQRSYYASNSTNTYFVACDLCSNGAYPSNPRKKLSSWPTVRCRDVYKNLLSLNKHANPTQCYNQAYAYRDACCDTYSYQTSMSRQSSSGSHSSLPLPSLSTVFMLFCIWFLAREYVRNRRRLRDGELRFQDDSSIPPQEGTEYKNMGSEETSKEAPQKLMKLGKRQRIPGVSSEKSSKDDGDEEGSNASPVLSFIQKLVSTPPHQKKNRPRDSFLPPEEKWTNYDEMGAAEKGEGAPRKLDGKLGSKSSRRQRSRSASRGRRSRRDDIDDDDSNASPVLSFIQMLVSTPRHQQPKNRRRRSRGRSRGRRSRSRSGSRSRSKRRTRSKSRPIIPAEPDPPQMQLV